MACDYTPDCAWQEDIIQSVIAVFRPTVAETDLER